MHFYWQIFFFLSVFSLHLKCNSSCILSAPFPHVSCFFCIWGPFYLHFRCCSQNLHSRVNAPKGETWRSLYELRAQELSFLRTSSVDIGNAQCSHPKTLEHFWLPIKLFYFFILSSLRASRVSRKKLFFAEIVEFAQVRSEEEGKKDNFELL